MINKNVDILLVCIYNTFLE